jgi:hypothetical protein
LALSLSEISFGRLFRNHGSFLISWIVILFRVSDIEGSFLLGTIQGIAVSDYKMQKM